MEIPLALIPVIVGIVGGLVGIPLTLLLVIFGIAGIVQYISSSKKKSKYSLFYLVLGTILILISIIFWTAVLLF